MKLLIAVTIFGYILTPRYQARTRSEEVHQKEIEYAYIDVRMVLENFAFAVEFKNIFS